MTPGEAKRSYAFIRNAILESENASYNEVETFLYNFYKENKNKVDYNKLEYILDKNINANIQSDDNQSSIMASFIDYAIKNNDKEKYIKHLKNILCYICNEPKIIDKIIKLYTEYDELREIEKNRKENYLETKLNDLVGLENIKDQIKQLSDWAYITKLRQEQGLKTNSITMHMVFTGSPGTGKTTIARIIADLYYNLGIIKENKLIEVSREDLVAEYLGQSEIKTKKVLESSKNGVLFIDEAYSLTKNNDEYGSDVVNTILKFMEDNRDNTVIIIAGYQKEIEQFIKSNPGLKSRFNTYLNFNNYNSNELLEILKILIEKNDYTISKQDLDIILDDFNKIDTTDITFANARYVRNIFENAIKKQSSRLADKKDITKTDLQALIYDDFKE